LAAAQERQIIAAILKVCAQRSHLNDNVCRRKHFRPSSYRQTSIQKKVIGKTGCGSGVLLDKDRYSTSF
jgi:hypothetical protein